MSDPIRLCPTCRHPLILPLPRREGRCAVLVEMVHPGDFDPCGCADPAHTRPRGRFALLGSFGTSTRRARSTAPLSSGTAREQPAD